MSDSPSCEFIMMWNVFFSILLSCFLLLWKVSSLTWNVTFSESVFKTHMNLFQTVSPAVDRNQFESAIWSQLLPVEAFLDTSNWEEEAQNRPRTHWVGGLDFPSGLGTPQDSQEELGGDVWDALLSLLLTRPGLMPLVKPLYPFRRILHQMEALLILYVDGWSLIYCLVFAFVFVFSLC